MKVLSILLIIGLIVFTGWQIFLTIKKIALKKQLKKQQKEKESVVHENSKSNDADASEDNSTKEVE